MSWDFVLEILKLSLAGAVGGYATFKFEKRKQLFTKNIDDKRSIYNDFTSMVIDIIKNSKESKKVEDEIDPELLDRFYEFYKKFLLYASDKSIEAFGDWMGYLRSAENLDNKIWIDKLSLLLGSMRKDLGLSNFWLGTNNSKLLRPILIDFDEIYRNKK